MSNKTQTLDDKSVLLHVEFHKLGNTRRVNTSEIEADADKSMLRVNKMLLDATELEAIKTHDGRTRQWLYSRALPSMFKEGVFRVPNKLVIEVDDYLKKRAFERSELVEAFKAKYPQRVTEALERLGALARQKDYLSADAAAAQFSLVWRIVSFGTPDSLKNLKEGLFERERDKMQKLIQDANEEIKQVLRVQMAALVKRMVAQLTPSVDGKKKKIYDSLTGNVEDFLSTFDARNIADDVELKKLVAKAREALKGVNADVLREADDVRKTVAENFTTMKNELDKMIVDKPSRQFDFGD